MKILLICLYMTILVGCTSESLGMRYYLLHAPESSEPSMGDETASIVVLQSLKVADYLRESSLVMQMNEHELHYSQHDFWAEKLQSSFYKALLQDLNKSDTQRYVASYSPNAVNALTAMTIKLEHFHITSDSTVVSSGRYWLSKDASQNIKENTTVTAEHSFYFENTLQQDGYPHAVKQLRMLVDQIAKQIEKDIEALPHN